MADLGAHSTWHVRGRSTTHRAGTREHPLSAQPITLHVAQWRLELSATRNSILRHHVHLQCCRYRFQQMLCMHETQATTAPQ
jgi:hypothetical protein